MLTASLWRGTVSGVRGLYGLSHLQTGEKELPDDRTFAPPMISRTDTLAGTVSEIVNNDRCRLFQA